MPHSLANGLTWYAVFLFSTACHEAAHAWSAFRMGDPTARDGGQMSLNPWPHVRREPIGMVAVPILSWLMGGFLMGWASAPYSVAWAQAHPRKAALMALAGPAANLFLLVSAMLLIRLGLEWNYFAPPFPISPDAVAIAAQPGPLEFVAHLLSVFFSLNLLLFVFNLVPLPPLDGCNIPLLLLPPRAAEWYASLMRTPFVRLAGLLIVLRGLGSIFLPILRAVGGLLYFDAHI
jgi:Zn-dependent protease